VKQQLTQQEFFELFGKLMEGLSVHGSQETLGTANQPWRELRSKLVLFGYPDRKVCEMAARKLFAKPELLTACEDALERLEYVVKTEPNLIGYGPRYATIENLKKVIAAEREGTASKVVPYVGLVEELTAALEHLTPAECPIVTHHNKDCSFCRALKLIAKVRGKGENTDG
jgi:hypothetical protein